MISVVRYQSQSKEEWNNLVNNAKNGLFLFDRNYMEYHQSRFWDHSLLFYKKNSLIAALPANIADDVLHSHAGLTFGGIIMDKSLQTSDILEIFNALMDYAKENHITKILYKAIPSIYHTIPAEEDRYALFLKGGTIIRRDLTSTLNMREPALFTTARKRKIRMAEKNTLQIREDDNYAEFWKILEDNLQQRYNKKPVHTLEEIRYLKNLFPAHIRLFSCYEDDRMASGAVIYESANVAHIQYNASTEGGRRLSALDLVISHLITRIFPAKRFFDFGISTEDMGRYFNRDLAFYKESFGARAIVHDTYELTVP